MPAPHETSPMERGFWRQVLSTFFAGVSVALGIWVLCWVPGAIQLMVSGSIPDDSPWAQLVFGIGPALADSIDPLLPTALTILLALCISEIWTLAPRALVSAAHWLSILVIAWVGVAFSTFMIEPLLPLDYSVPSGQIFAGLVMALLVAVLDAWITRVAPYDLQKRLAALDRRKAAADSEVEAYKTAGFKPEEVGKQGGWMLLAWFVPSLAVLVTATVATSGRTGESDNGTMILFFIASIHTLAFIALAWSAQLEAQGRQAGTVVWTAVLVFLVFSGALLFFSASLGNVQLDWLRVLLWCSLIGTLVVAVWRKSPYWRAVMLAGFDTALTQQTGVLAEREEVNQRLAMVTPASAVDDDRPTET